MVITTMAFALFVLISFLRIKTQAGNITSNFVIYKFIESVIGIAQLKLLLQALEVCHYVNVLKSNSFINNFIKRRVMSF